MVAVAVCALLFLTADPVAVLTIKSWMSTMSPAKVLSSFTCGMVSPKLHVEGYGKFITQQDLRLLKNCRLYFPFASHTILCLCQIWRKVFKKQYFLPLLREMKADLGTKKLCFGTRLLSQWPICFCSYPWSHLQPTPPTCPRPSASLGSLPARTTAASKSAGSVTGTTIVWTTVMRALSSAVSAPRHCHGYTATHRQTKIQFEGLS